MSPGFILAGRKSAIRAICVLNSYSLGRAKTQLQISPKSLVPQNYLYLLVLWDLLGHLVHCEFSECVELSRTKSAG